MIKSKCTPGRDVSCSLVPNNYWQCQLFQTNTTNVFIIYILIDFQLLFLFLPYQNHAVLHFQVQNI